MQGSCKNVLYDQKSNETTKFLGNRCGVCQRGSNVQVRLEKFRSSSYVTSNHVTQIVEGFWTNICVLSYHKLLIVMDIYFVYGKF